MKRTIVALAAVVAAATTLTACGGPSEQETACTHSTEVSNSVFNALANGDDIGGLQKLMEMHDATQACFDAAHISTHVPTLKEIGDATGSSSSL